MRNNKRTVRLTESRLRGMIREAVKRVLYEDAKKSDIDRFADALKKTYDFISDGLNRINEMFRSKTSDDIIISEMYGIIKKTQDKVGTMWDATAEIDLIDDIDVENYGCAERGEQRDYSGFAGWGG